jgi:hypothetical protein
MKARTMSWAKVAITEPRKTRGPRNSCVWHPIAKFKGNAAEHQCEQHDRGREINSGDDDADGQLKCRKETDASEY